MARHSRTEIWIKPFHCISRLIREQRGTTAVEFGLLAIPFFGIIFATIEVGYTHFENEVLAAAIGQAARQMAIGSVQNNSSVINANTFINTYLCPTSGARLIPANFNCSKLAVDIRPVSSMTGADMTNDIYKSPSNLFCPGQGGTTVVMRVTYPLATIFPLNIFNRSVGLVNDVPGSNGWFHILLGSAIFMVEPFGSYSAPQGC